MKKKEFYNPYFSGSECMIKDIIRVRLFGLLYSNKYFVLRIIRKWNELMNKYKDKELYESIQNQEDMKWTEY